MSCGNCGADVPPNPSFCPQCGEPVEQAGRAEEARASIDTMWWKTLLGLIPVALYARYFGVVESGSIAHLFSLTVSCAVAYAVYRDASAVSRGSLWETEGVWWALGAFLLSVIVPIVYAVRRYQKVRANDHRT